MPITRTFGANPLLLVLVMFFLSWQVTAVDPYDWDYMNCHKHGLYNGHFSNNGADRCICYEPNQWGGVECAMCKTNSACATGETCNTDFVLNKYKALSCFPQDPAHLMGLNGSISAEFDFPNCLQGSGVLSVFNYITGAPLAFNCSLTDCTKELDDNGVQTVVCQNIKCHATSWCAKIVQGLINNGVKGLTTLSCDRGGTCHVKNVPVLDVYLVCSAASCEEPYACGDPPPPPKPLPPVYKALFYVALFLGGCFFVTIITIVILIVAKRRESIRAHYWNTLEHRRIPATISFRKISCYINSGLGGKSQKQILFDIDGGAKPGQITAIMGPSGGGKTTLIDILSGRKNIGKITGEVLINGHKRKKNFKRLSGYVLQDDVMLGTLTVREQITYAAMLRLPSLMPHDQKLQRVDDVMRELGIYHIAESTIGTDMSRGISGGERKRVSIATELVTNPSVLFLDEPTSGLDAYNASSLMETLKKLALEHNTTVVLSIHQPRSDIFHMFDSLMVLSQGRLVYSGPPTTATQHFAKLGYVCPSDFNPADFIIDTITVHPNIGNEDSNLPLSTLGKGRIYKWPKDGNEDITLNLQQGVDNGTDDEGSDGMPEEEEFVDERTKKYLKRQYASSFFTQVTTLCKRTLMNIWRNPYLLRAQYILTVALAILLGFMFQNLSYDLYGIQGRAGCNFFLLCLLSFSCMSSLDTFFHERALFVRERAQGMYRTSAYFLAKTICDVIPLRVIPPIILGTVTYWMVGHPQSDPEYIHYIWSVCVLVLVSVVACSMCLAIGSSCPSMGVSNLVAILLMLFYMLFGGLLANKTTIPPFLNWFKWLSFMNYGYEVLMVNELAGTTVLFNPPNIPPVYTTGEEFLTQFDMDPNRTQLDVGVLFAMAVFYLTVSYLFLRFYIKERR
jgi:ABC-type multidrug transport system ATPase subunit/ABC-type multidrug transport system permease subunit